MFSFYPRPQPYYSSSPYQTYHQPSPYARALAQQQQRARALAQQQEMERQRAARSRYFPEGYDYQPESDEEDYDYLTPRQRAFIEAKRRQEALEQRRQAAARLAHENAMQQVRTAEKESTSPQSPLPRSVSPPVTRTPTPPPTVASPPSPSPELLEEAATKIQTKYRIHRSLRAISELASQFESLKSTFVPPTTIDYQAGDGTIVSVPVPATSAAAPAESAKLAFTPKNVPLHTYTELLNRLLVALDGVESRGDRGLRERRKGVVRAVEVEAARVEALWRSVWASHLEQEQQQRVGEEEEEVCAMVVDEAEIPLPELATPESESDVEPELPTPPATPSAAPELVLSPEPEPAQDDAVVIEIPDEDEKVSTDDFVLL